MPATPDPAAVEAIHRYRERLAICLDSGVPEQRAREIALSETPPHLRGWVVVAEREDRR